MTRTGRLMAGAVALSAIALLSACDDHAPPRRTSQVGTPQGQQQQTIYRNLDACLADAKDMDAVQACRDGYTQAMAKMAEAPKYETVASCEEIYGYGNCVPRGTVVHDGGGWFVPMMMGYMIGGGFGRSYSYYPVYVDRGGTTFAGGYRSPSGSPTVNSPSWQGGAPAAVRPSSSSVVRGGFGSSATASAANSSGG